MLYTSTRNNKIRVTAAQAIAQGISEEGAFFHGHGTGNDGDVLH